MIKDKLSFLNGNRIKLLNCDQEILKLLLEDDKIISKNLKIKVPENWSIFGKEMFDYSITKLKEDSSSCIWLTYLPIEKKLNYLLGTCGYKGQPDENGIVEIGYEICERFRNRGYATEIAKILVENAFKHPEVNVVIAHTLAEENASVSVLKKSGFKFLKEISDDDDGLIWQWEIQNN